MNRYDTEIERLQEQVARKHKLEAMLNSLKARQQELTEKERELNALRVKEQADVDRLERGSLAAFFYTVVGKKEEKLAQEKEEAYAAAVKHDAVVAELDAVSRDIYRCAEELKRLQDCEEQYRKVLAQKAALLKTMDPDHAAVITDLEERLGYLKSQYREIEEAISAGQAALKQVAAVEGNLNSAEGWGTWDMIGGGLIASLAKHSRLDEAQRQVEELQVLLSWFRTELADVTIDADLQIQIDGFLRFADFFFDGLFADWAVLNEIRNSQKRVAHVKDQINDVLARLAGMKADLETQIARTKQELHRFIAGA